MNPEQRIDFEDEGLRIDENRVLTYSQLVCPFDCKYCFSNDLNFNQKKDVAYLSEKQLELFNELPQDIRMIMLGCDTEFFQPQANTSEILRRLSTQNRDISVVTKMHLSREMVRMLSEVDGILGGHGNFIAFTESITSIRSARQWEPKAPVPEKRISTLGDVYKTGIRTFVAIRPLLPTVDEDEMRELIESTKDFCTGYYSGPLYLKSLDHLLLGQCGNRNDLSIERIEPHWMPSGNEFFKVEKPGQMEALKRIIQENDRILFEGAADAMNYWRGDD